MYAGILALLNLLQGLGSALLCADIIEGLWYGGWGSWDGAVAGEVLPNMKHALTCPLCPPPPAVWTPPRSSTSASSRPSSTWPSSGVFSGESSHRGPGGREWGLVG